MACRSQVTRSGPSIDKMTVEAPIAPRRLDLGGLTDEQFEEICHRLVRLEFPDVHRTHNPDGGADALLPKPEGGWTRGWQAKRYTGTIYWSKCKKSLDDAGENYGIEHMTFCLPRNLTVGQQKKFQKELVGRGEGVVVDLWDLDELLARLEGSEEGKRIARHYFGDPAHDKDSMLRAIRAGGKLETVGDALERARPLAEFLGKRDPFFAYPSVQHEAEIDMPAPPGTIMSVGGTEEGISVRIDAVPRDADALERYAPRLRMDFDPDERGQRAVEAIARAVREGREVSVDEGVEITAEQLPPLFEEMVGKPARGAVTLRPERRVPAPWQAVFTATSDRGTATVRLPLRFMPTAPAGWDGGFDGRTGGMTVQILFRWLGDHGETTINWRHALDDSPAREQVAALRFIDAMHGAGELTIRDEAGGRPELKRPIEPREIEENFIALLALLENIVVIEDWTAETIPLPDTITPDDASTIALTAAVIRRRELPVHWENAEAEMASEAIEQISSGKQVTIEQELGVRILGHEVALGHGTLGLPDVEVRDLGPSATDGLRRIELRPAGGGPVSLAWALLPPSRG